MSNQQPAVYGGQAVVEGVMFAGKTVHVTAVRCKDDSIAFYEVPRDGQVRFKWLRKIPLIRGIFGLFDAAANGSKHLQYSMEMYASEDGTPVMQETSWWEKIGITLSVAAIGVLSLIFSKTVFTAFPAAIEHFLFANLFENQGLHAAIEGLIKIMLLFGYLYLISLTPPIKRLFQYHGAEHKVISAYEAGKELTVQNVQKFSTLHYRCGSSFMVFTVIVGVIVYSLFNLYIMEYTGIWDRIIQRLYLLPLVIGISYEVLRMTNSVREIPLLRYLGYPGLWLQKLTTKEPEDHQVEVAIASFNRMLELDNNPNQVRTT